MVFSRTKAVNKILGLKKRKRVIQGGTWAGKTYAIIAVIINEAASNPNADILVVAESIPTLKKGAMKDFLSIMNSTERFVRQRWNISDRIYSFANGAKVQFDSFDSPGKAKAAGKRTHLFLNESNHIPFSIADTLMTRTSDVIWIDFNPDAEFWAHTEIGDCDRLILTYQDNDQTPDSIVTDLVDKLHKAYYDPYGDHHDPKNIKSTFWVNWCNVYVYGQIGILEGVIFQNWKQVDEIPQDAELLGYGLDFGFTNDPTAAVAVWYCDGIYYLDEICYDLKLLNIDIYNKIKAYGITNTTGVADSAEPRTIQELKKLGLTLVGADKGQGSVNFGIELLQSHEFLVTARSLNLIEEFRHYRWAEDKTGKTLNEPIGDFNHLMDALRYWASKNLKLKVKKRRGIKVYR